MIESLGSDAAMSSERPAHQLAQQPVGEIVEIAHALAHIRVGHVHHARAHVALHLLDRRFGGQAVADRLLQPPHPAAIVGEHAVGFEHVAMLALERHLAARQHVVDRQPQRAQRRVEPPDFRFGILVEQVGDDDARLVQHDMAEPDAIVEGGAAERAPAAAGRVPCLAATAARDRRSRSSRRSPSRWSRAPRPRPRDRCAWCGSGRPARRACARPAAPARRGRSDRSPRPSPADRRRPDAPARWRG